MPRSRALLSLAVLIALASSGCGAGLRRFPLREPLWLDDDMRAFGPPPEEWYSPFVWDGVDNSTFRPLSEAFALELDRESVDVNAMDEVPSSSWYTNRLATEALSPERVARGACEDEDPEVPGIDDDVRGPLTITRGKPDGSTPGFIVRDAQGRMYLMKPDGELQPERAPAADAIGAAVFWAAGFHTPCNRVVLVARADLELDPGAEVRRTDGRREPLTPEMVEHIVERASLSPDGRLRFSLSRFVDGQPISPWRYEGTWDEDPNDVIPHQHRREVRAMYVLSSWLSHIDSRQENTMASWTAGEDGRGHVRHYMIDFSDTLGIVHTWGTLSRRFGHSGYVDFGHMAEDFVTLGLLDRPWHHAAYGPTGATLGYYDVEHYQPDAFRPGYPNPAYERMTELDAAWMARILARFSDAHLRALVERARLSRPEWQSALFSVLRGRRDRALERWLTRRSPLTEPRITEDGSLCLEDRAVSSGVRPASTRAYRARAYEGSRLEPRELPARARAARVCVALRGAPEGYLVIDVIASTRDRETTGPLRVHAHVEGSRARVVGLERPEGAEAPRP